MAEFVDLDRWMAHRRPADAVVALRDGAAVTFAEFATLTAGWRAAFAEVAGTRVALHFEDSLDFAAALFGAWHAGKQAVLPPDLLPGTLRRLSAEVCAIASDLPTTTDLPQVRPLAVVANTAWLALDPQRDALHVFTSGSTGEPVLIGKRLAQLCAEIRALDAAFGDCIGGGCVHASVTHQHMYGLPFRLLWPMASGRVFASQRLGFPEDMQRALADAPGATLVTSPAHLKRLPEQLDWAPVRAQIGAIFSSGGPLPDEALPLCDRVFGRRPIEIYGSSETGAVAWRQRELDASSPWLPLPGMTVRIDGERLHLRAPWLREADEQEVADRVAAHAQGFALLGRADRVVKIEEKRVSLDAIERDLRDSGLLLDVRALVLSDERARIGVVAVPDAAGWAIHDNEGRRALVARLRALLATRVEAVALPRHWRFIWAMPANATGKTTSAALQALFDARRPHARLLAQDEQNARLHVEVATDSPFFDGHFSGSPILPGVAQIDWAIRFARELFSLPEGFSRLDQIKFHDWIGAGTQIELTLQRVAADTVAFRIASDVGSHASGRLVFGATT